MCHSAFLYLSVFIIPLIFASSQFPIQLSVGQEKRFFPHEISTYTQHVNIQIKTGPNAHIQSPPPQELFLVLDSSGSMAGGQKWMNAVLAIEGIIRNMNSEDKLHLIEYNSRSSIVFEDENDQQRMLNALHALRPSGGTNLMAGFDQVITLLKKYSTRPTLKRLFVFSDGQINEGVTQHDQLLEEVTLMKQTYEISICSFGIGHDFDEKLMTNIADHGAGDYFFIDGADSMKKVVDIAYKGFQALMGTNAYLKITTKNDAHIVDVYGYDMKDEENQIIPIGDLRYNDMMNILLETEVKITEKILDKRDIDYMIVELWMTDIVDRSLKLVASESVLFSLSKNEEELNNLNMVIKHLVELQKIQRREKEVSELLKENRVEEARTLKVALNKQIISQSEYFDSVDGLESDEAMETIHYAREASRIMERRSADTITKFDDSSLDSEKLKMHNEYSRKLTDKFKTAHGDL